MVGVGVMEALRLPETAPQDFCEEETMYLGGKPGTTSGLRSPVRHHKGLVLSLGL